MIATVRTKDNKHIDVVVLREAGGLILHGAVPPDTGYTVTHSSTGAAIWAGQPMDIAERFFDAARMWPEWQRGESVGDFQCLRERVLDLRAQAVMR